MLTTGFARSTCCRVDGGGVARTSTAGSRARLRSRSYRTPTWRTITRQCGSLTGRGEIAWRSRGDGSALAVQLNNSTRQASRVARASTAFILPPCGAGITQAVPGAAVRFSIPARGGGAAQKPMSWRIRADSISKMYFLSTLVVILGPCDIFRPHKNCQSQ